VLDSVGIGGAPLFETTLGELDTLCEGGLFDTVHLRGRPSCADFGRQFSTSGNLACDLQF
jgi:hypothetical protein